MQEAKHTPGPWECDPIGHEVYETERMTVIATLPLVRTIADARLIAAAPDLLEALIAIVEQSQRLQDAGVVRNRETNERWIQAKAAIAKATEGGAV